MIIPEKGSLLHVPIQTHNLKNVQCETCMRGSLIYSYLIKNNKDWSDLYKHTEIAILSPIENEMSKNHIISQIELCIMEILYEGSYYGWSEYNLKETKIEDLIEFHKENLNELKLDERMEIIFEAALKIAIENKDINPYNLLDHIKKLL